MSELTPCNLCNMQRIKAAAKARGATVEVVLQRTVPGEKQGWWTVESSDRGIESHMLEIPDRCVC